MEDWLWCPILQDWDDQKSVTAAHLFPCMHGKAAMERNLCREQLRGTFRSKERAPYVKPH